MTMGCLQVIPALLLASACVTAGPLTSEGPELLDLWADQNIDDINFELSGDDLEPILEMVSSDSQLDYRQDSAGGCGNICHASLLTIAGLASYAVYNGLATDNFLTRRQEDISLIEEKIEEARETVLDIKDRLGQAWKVSEKKALTRKMKRKQDEIADNKLILQKRKDFLDLVKQGLSTWKGQDDQDQETSATMESSWGRDLGLRVRQALSSYRRQQTLKSRNDENVEDEDGKDDDENRESTAIKLGRDLGKRIRFALNYAKRQEALRQKATEKVDGGPSLLGGIVEAINPINSVMWWFNRMNENKRRRRTDEGKKKKSSFRRRHSRPKHRRVDLYDSDDGWRPSTFHKNMKNHRLSGEN